MLFQDTLKAVKLGVQTDTTSNSIEMMWWEFLANHIASPNL